MYWIIYEKPIHEELYKWSWLILGSCPGIHIPTEQLYKLQKMQWQSWVNTKCWKYKNQMSFFENIELAWRTKPSYTSPNSQQIESINEAQNDAQDYHITLRPTLIPGTFLHGVEEWGFGNCTKCVGTITRRERGVGGGTRRRRRGGGRERTGNPFNKFLISKTDDVKLQ